MRRLAVLLALVFASTVAAEAILLTHHHRKRPCLISSYGPVVGKPGKANLPGPPPTIEKC